MKSFALEIVTPDKQIFEGEVVSVTVPGTQGSFQVLHNHAPIISTLGKGTVKLEDPNNQTVEYEIADGVVEVLNNKVIVLVESLLKSSGN